MLIFFSIIAGAILLFSLAAITYYAFGWFGWYFHDRLGWHIPDHRKGMTYDGINIYASCKRCRKEIMQDSQGNWFATGGE